jgi:hypothetical protein
MEKVNGTINKSRSASVMNATAKPRLPPSHACMRSMSGQDATTIMTAQMKEGRNDFRIQ